MDGVLVVPVCSVNIAYLPSLALFIDGVRSAHPEAHANARVDIEGFSGAAGGQVGCRVNQRLRPCENPHTAECLHAGARLYLLFVHYKALVNAINAPPNTYVSTLGWGGERFSFLCGHPTEEAQQISRFF